MIAIRAIALDVDGVLTDGGVFWGPDGGEWKRFCFADIMGVSLARKAGIAVTLISGEDSPLVDRFAAKLELTDITKGCKDKAAGLRAFADRHGLRLEEICFMGDDVNDLAAMEIAGISAAPADARPAALRQADMVTHASGGNGAVRELVDLILSGAGNGGFRHSNRGARGAGYDRSSSVSSPASAGALCLGSRAKAGRLPIGRGLPTLPARPARRQAANEGHWPGRFGLPAAFGRLPIGRRLPTCPTSLQRPVCEGAKSPRCAKILMDCSTSLQQPACESTKSSRRAKKPMDCSTNASESTPARRVSGKSERCAHKCVRRGLAVAQEKGFRQ